MDTTWLEVTLETTTPTGRPVRQAHHERATGLVIEDEEDFKNFLEQNGSIGTMWTTAFWSG